MTCACGQPVTDATICSACERRLADALASIPGLTAEIDTVLARQTKQGGQHVGYVTSSPTRPLPYDTAMSDASGRLKAVLVSWTRLVMEETGAEVTMRNDAASLSRFLGDWLPFLRVHAAGGEAVDEIVQAVADVRRQTMREAPEKHYRGPCGNDTWTLDDGATACCLADLYATGLHVETVTCKQCGQRHNSTDRRDWLIGEADKRLLTQAELLVLLRSLYPDTPLKQARLGMWVNRGRLQPHGANQQGKRLFRVGDAVALLTGEKVSAA